MLCFACSETHKEQKCFKNHTLQQGIDRSTSEDSLTTHGQFRVMCSCSQNNQATIYCEDHDNILCQVCQHANHSICKIMSIENKADSFDPSCLNAVIRRAHDIKTVIEITTKRKIESLCELEVYKEKCKNDIGTFRSELNEFLNLLEENTLKDMEKQKALQKAEIENHISRLDKAKNNLQSETDLLERASKSTHIADKLVAKIKSSKSLGQYETLLEDSGHFPHPVMEFP